MNGDELISAQVVLKADSAADPDAVTGEFARAGFTVGPVFANTFSVAAPVERFESYFGVHLGRSPRGGLEVTSPGGPARTDLPIQAMPPAVRTKTEAVLFTSPPDFGPTDY